MRTQKQKENQGEIQPAHSAGTWAGGALHADTRAIDVDVHVCVRVRLSLLPPLTESPDAVTNK